MYDAVQRAVADAVTSAGLELVNPKEMAAAGPIADMVLQAIDEADVVIAILTGNNPNVFFELGRARQAAAILISESVDNIPFDVRHLRVLTYDSEAALSTLSGRLEAAIRATRATRPIPRLPALNRPDYRSEIDHIISYRTTIFIGRDEDLAMVARVAEEREPKYLLVSGGAGTGKSALVAELVRRHEERRWPTAIRPRLLFVFVRQEGGANRSIDFMRALNAQMLALSDADEPIAFESPAIETQFARLWTSSMQLARAEDPLLLLVDGLDEAAVEGSADVIRHLPSTLTNYVHVMVTSRPSPDPRLRVDLGHPLRGAQAHELRAFTVGEVEELLRSMGATPPELSALARRVWKATKGLPLLARFVSKDAVSDVSRLDALENNPPTDIRDYFVKQFEQLDAIAETKDSAWAVFRTFVVGLGPMTTEDLTEILGWSKNQVVKAIAAGERFLVSGQDGWELMHVELRRVLQERQFSSRELGDAKQGVVAWCRTYQAKGWPSTTPVYVLRYFLRHLSEREEDRSVVDACAAGYLEAKLERLLSPRDFEDDYSVLLTSCVRLADREALYAFTQRRARLADEVAVLARLEQWLDVFGQVVQSRESVAWRRWVVICVLGQRPIGLLNLCAGLTPDGTHPTEIFDSAEALIVTLALGDTRDQATHRLVRELTRWGAVPLARARRLCESIGAPHVRASANRLIASGYAEAGQPPNALAALTRSLSEVEQVLRSGKDESSILATFIEIAQTFPTVGAKDDAKAGLDHVVSLSSLIANPESASKVVTAASHGFAVLGDTTRATSLLIQTLIEGRPSRFAGITPAQATSAIVEHSNIAGASLEIRGILERISEAVGHVADRAVQAQVLAAVAHGYATCGDMDVSSQVLARAITAGAPSGESGDDVSACVDTYGGLATDDAQACLDRVRATLESISNGQEHTELASLLARGYSMAGRDDIACDLLDREFQQLVRKDLDLSWALSHLSQGYTSLRDVSIARRRLDGLLERGASLRDAISVSHVLSELSGSFERLGVADVARRIDRLHDLVAEGLSSAVDRSAAYSRAAAVYARVGDVDNASRSLYQAARAAADSNSFGYFGIHLKYVFASFRDRSAAAHVLERLPAILVDSGNTAVVVRMLLALARCAGAARDDAQTRALLERAHQSALRNSAEAARCGVLCDIALVADRLQCTELVEATLDDAERAARQFKAGFGWFVGVAPMIESMADVVGGLTDDQRATRWLIRLGRIVVDKRPSEDVGYARSLSAVARACTNRPRSAELRQIVEEMWDLAPDIADVYERTRMLVALTDAVSRHSGSDAARERLEQLQGTLAAMANQANRAEVMALIAGSFVGMGESSVAVGLLQDAYELVFPESGSWQWGSASIAAICAIVGTYGRLADDTQAIGGLRRACATVARLPWDARMVVAEIAKSHAAILSRGSYVRMLDAWHSAAAPGIFPNALIAPVYWRTGKRAKAIDVLSQGVENLTYITDLERRKTALSMVAHGAAEIQGDLRGADGFLTLLRPLTRMAEECGCPEVLALVGRSFINAGEIDAAVALLTRMTDADTFADLCANLLRAATSPRQPDELFDRILIASAPKGSGMLVRAIEERVVRSPKTLSQAHLEQLDRALTAFTDTVLAAAADGGETLESGAVGAARAAILVNAGRYEDAARQYAKAAETYELQHAESWRSWGLSLSEQDLHEAAVEKYERALTVNPLDGLTQALYGLSESRLGHPTKAADRYRTAIPLLPGHARPSVAEDLFNAGSKMFDAGDFENAARAFADAGNYHADRVKCAYWRGACRFNVGELKAAEEDFSFALEQDATHASARRLRVRTRFAMRRYADAEADLTELIDRGPVTGDAFYWRGRALASQGKAAEALRDFSRAIELDQDARSYYWRGQVRQALQTYADAEDDATMAIERDYGALAYELRGEVRERLGNLQEAEQDFSRAVEAAPGEARLRLARGRVRLSLSEFSGADEDFSAALESGYQRNEVSFQRGLARLSLGRFPAAEEDFCRAGADGAASPEIAYWIGVSRLNQGKLVEARSDLTTAISGGLKESRVSFALGLVKAGLNDYAGAETDLTAAVTAGMDSADVFRYRSHVRLRLGALAGAIEDCTLVEAKATGSPDALRVRAYLDLATGAFENAVTAYRLALAAQTDAETQFELGLALLFANEFETAQATYADAASEAARGEVTAAIGELEYWTGKYSDRLGAPDASSAVAAVRSTLLGAAKAHES